MSLASLALILFCFVAQALAMGLMVLSAQTRGSEETKRLADLLNQHLCRLPQLSEHAAETARQAVQGLADQVGGRPKELAERELALAERRLDIEAKRDEEKRAVKTLRDRLMQSSRAGGSALTDVES